MTNDEKQSIIEAATPGPWYIAPSGIDIRQDDGVWLGGVVHEEDAKLVVAARTEWPKDLERLELLETAAKQLVDEIIRLNPLASAHNHRLKRLVALLREGDANA